MLLDSMFAPFVKERPLCVMARAVLERLWDAPRLAARFARTAPQPSPREGLCSAVVPWMRAVVRGGHPTGHAASQANTEAMGVSTTAMDNTLDRVETGVSAARVRAAAERAEPVVRAVRASHPRGLPGEQRKGLDGHHGSSTEHRRKAWRSTWAAPVPGQALVVRDQPRLLIPDVVLHEAGQAQERRLIAAVLQHVKADDLWMAARHLCPRGLMCGMARRGAACVGRQHGPWQGERVGRRTRQGASRSGPVSAQPLLVRDPDRGAPMRVRRITGTRTEPTRDGDTALHRRRNVPTHRAAAAQRARLDGTRWRIATAFVESTTPLSCEMNTVGSPTAALVTFCLALWADNAVSRIKAALRRAHGRQQGHDEVSGSALAWEMSRTDDGRMMAIPAPHWALFRARSLQECATVWRELAAAVHRAKYQKHPRGPQKVPPERTAYQHGKHVSTAQLLA